jgi:hypothetical protein
VVGRVGIGKSTLINALIGGDVLVTGKDPTTCAVTVLRNDPVPSLTIQVRHGRPARRLPLSSLTEVTARGTADAQNTADACPGDVPLVELRGPYRYLRGFDLVDTPGFDSPYAADTQACVATFGSIPDDPTASPDHLAQAHAVVSVLKVDGIFRSDADVLARFRPDGGFVPRQITSLAVLTRVEKLWPGEPGREIVDPLTSAARNARLIMTDPATTHRFAEVYPVCSKVASAANTLTDADLDDLLALARLPATALNRWLADRSTFGRAERDGVTVPPARRAALAGRFTPYGISLACDLIRQGACDVPGLRDALSERSGITGLRSLLLQRFGARDDLIKLARAVEVVQQIPAHLPTGMDPRRRAAVEEAVAAVAALRTDELAFEEFELLRDHDAGVFPLAPEVAVELRRLAGDHGRSAAARLGLPDGTPLPELEELARQRLAGRPVVPVIRRRYEQLFTRIVQARHLLEEIP